MAPAQKLVAKAMAAKIRTGLKKQWVMGHLLVGELE